MGLPNFSLSHWYDLPSAAQLTTTLWNGLKNDVKSVLQNLNTDNFLSHGLGPTRFDGTLMTRHDGGITGNSGEQTLSVAILFSSLSGSNYPTVAFSGATVHPVTTHTTNTGTNVTVSSIRVLNLERASSSVSIYHLTGALDQQELLVLLSPAGTGAITLKHGTNANSMMLAQGADIVYDANTAVRPFVLHLARNIVDISLASPVAVWVEVGRVNLA